MVLSVKEMELLCVFHAGTLSATLDLLRKAEDQCLSLERQTHVHSVIEKLSGMKDGDVVALAFEPED